jgi:glycosyltransferase involved in cell wall biosynthesis
MDDVAAPKPLAISIVIPAYNEEAYLGQCLDAIAAHAAAGVCEIIVVDNASTDGTRALIESRAGVSYVFEPAKGITRARQCGFRHARGDVLAFVDADTRPPAGWIEQIAARFAGDPGLACLSGPYLFYDASPFRRGLAALWYLAARPVYHLLGYLVLGGNFAIRRAVLEAMGGFDTEIDFYGEDADIGRRASRHGRVLFSPRFVMPTSARRLAEDGYVGTAWTYFANFFSVALRGRPVTRSHKDVR